MKMKHRIIITTSKLKGFWNWLFRTRVSTLYIDGVMRDNVKTNLWATAFTIADIKEILDEDKKNDELRVERGEIK